MAGAGFPALLGGLLLLTGWAAAQAASFGLSPVRLSLTPGQPVAVVTVRNQGAETAVVQLEAMTWTQAGERDVYAPTREILATPPIFTVPAGAAQIVRVGLRRDPEPQRELSYRVFFQEVPPPRLAPSQGLRVALRIGVPVFVPPAASPAVPILRWELFRTSPTGIKVRATNLGNVHVRIAGLRLASTEMDRILASIPLSATLLAGQSGGWPLELERPLRQTRVQLTAETSAGPLDGGLLGIQAP